MDSTIDKLVNLKIFKGFFLVIVAWFAPYYSVAGNNQVVAIVLSDNHGYYQQCAQVIVETLQSNKHKTEFHTRIYNAQELKNGKLQLEKHDVLVAIGSDASAYAMTSESRSPLLNVLLPRQSYLELLENHNDINLRNVTAIFIDQPARRIVALAKALPIKIDIIGAITSAGNIENAKAIGRILANENIRFNHQVLTDQQNPVQALKPLFIDSDAFIAIPDKAIFNRAMARWILSLSIRQKVPVIGFSHAYTEAGALVSIFSTPDDIGRHAGELLIDQLKDLKKVNPSGFYPKYFTVEVNSVIARSMAIDSTRIEPQLLKEQVMVQEAEYGAILD